MNPSTNEMEKSGYLKEDFRLFHIKDQTRREYDWHYHDFHKLIIFVSGRVTYHIEGKAYRLKPWDILLVSRGAIHRPEIDFSLPYERFILWIRADSELQELLTCFRRASDRSFNLVRQDSYFQEKLKNIPDELETALKQNEFGDEMLSRALFTQLMVYINRIFLDKTYIMDKKSYSSDSQIEQLLRYINSHLAEDLSIDSLAKRFYFSKYHMMRKFREDTGYTVHNYVTSKRLIRARSLISSGVPVIKAAEQSGFGDYTTFVRAYKKQFGAAPSKRI